MFKSLKNALGFGIDKGDATTMDAAASRSASSYLAGQSGKASQIEGKIRGKAWRLEQGKPSRDFIKGIELRARGEMGVNEDVAVMILTRSLKNELDKRAFSLYTDTLQTQVNPHLPEEMRWLAMYEEVGWEDLGPAFLERYAILADSRAHAASWVKSDLVKDLLAWPSREPHVPRVLMVLRGKVYLRMQINEGDIASLEHATRVFTTACDAAIDAFSTDIVI